MEEPLDISQIKQETTPPETPQKKVVPTLNFQDMDSSTFDIIQDDI